VPVVRVGKGAAVAQISGVAGTGTAEAARSESLPVSRHATSGFTLGIGVRVRMLSDDKVE
jgi:hypothetical protein